MDGIPDRKTIEAVMESVSFLGEIVGGLRANLVRQGFSDQAAEFMAVHYYNHLIDSMFEKEK